MNAHPHSISSSWPLPESRRAEVAQQLAENEELLAWMEGDLDANLHFTSFMLIISNARILAKSQAETSWHEFPLHKGLSLQRRDHAGVGSLELFNGKSRLACWRYTLAHQVAAQRLSITFEEQLADLIAGHPLKRPTSQFVQIVTRPLLRGRRSAPSARLLRIPRPQPGYCSACGSLHNLTRGSYCWVSYSRWPPRPPPWCRLI